MENQYMLSKKEYSYYIRKIHSFLNQGHSITFKKMYKFAGSIDYKNNKNTASVTLDHRYNFLSTCVHEILHDIHPNKSESWILKMEKKIINKMSSRQARNISKKIINNSKAT